MYGSHFDFHLIAMGETAPPYPGLTHYYLLSFLPSSISVTYYVALKFQPPLILNFDVFFPNRLTFIKLPNNGNIGASSEAIHHNQGG